MKAALNRLVRCDSGASAVEYGLLALGMAVAIIAAGNLVGTALSTVVGKLSNNLS